ncbi:Periplasmic sensor signal transduction histidine kinase [Candidatus Competibacter denitrificans Run_A_D11]|uniref:histidine kinase n=1 Tax=Candidatus Competibacter denitrificans Run_A_D11 TaxID=1400863 RepID=W6MBR9_9GAMM|nr:sensor histidine kinase [Candidatus Competibacter denitrificans]CDI01478.1 Periplasmic sensor signal transduction histidine kinase [Candidatus Competibacter denitrificans Run_A_D11]HRC68539.1 sensor histidine kinase [Candidatus Competibacter denitrificans]
MLSDSIIIGSALSYMGVLFAIAYYGDHRADIGRSIIANPYIYTLSLAIYCTAWTFYGSVGLAATGGVDFLPVYLGPTLMAVLFWFVLRRIVRITKIHRITSIADFVASRYGKSGLLAGMVTVIVVLGILPYISIQLKAIATSFSLLRRYPMVSMAETAQHPVWSDTTFYVALVLIVFAILFGTRHIDNTERHEGMVAAVAFESLFKLVAFVTVGIAVTFGMFGGPADLFEQAATKPELAALMRFEAVPGGYGGWLSLTFLAMMAFLFLPRQFQVLVVENVNETHIRKAIWLFPLYLFIINLFVLPIALGGRLTFPQGGVDADMFVLALPMANHKPDLALLAFLGGLSAATSMILFETITLSTMVCNDLVMPLLLRANPRWLAQRTDLSGLLLGIRRAGIAVLILLGYLYYRFIGESYALVTSGLVSFAAAAQFAPPILIGLFWKRANRRGALIGLSGGFVVWAYTLLLPAMARSGWLDTGFIEHGPYGVELLKPYAVLGLDHLDPYMHAVFWSMLFNIGGLVFGSLLSRPDPIEQVQGSQFVNVLEQDRHDGDSLLWRGVAETADLYDLLARFLGPQRASEAFDHYAHQHNGYPLQADSRLIHYTERLLAGAIGAASARVMISSIVMGEVLSIEEVMTILDESTQVIEYSRRLEQKSRELEATSAELREANNQLQKLDQLKDEFISTVTHELRTPLTSIRAFSEILLANPDVSIEQRSQFLGIVVKESERLTRLINQVLDMAKIDSGRIDWHIEEIDLRALIQDAINSTSQLFRDKLVALHADLGDRSVIVVGDRDRLIQVIINLLSNAVKFCPDQGGEVTIRLHPLESRWRVVVTDNGPGIAADQHQLIFEKFHQVTDVHGGKPKGTGLGLPISQKIVEHHGGSIWVESILGEGASFIVDLPSKPNSE